MITTKYETFEAQQEISMDDDLDLELRKLVQEAQKHPDKSAERRKVFNKLIKKIQNSGQLKRFQEWQKLPDFEAIYQESESNTYLEICKNVDKYNPEYKVMSWVNRVFNWRFKDVIRQYYNYRSRVSLFDEFKDTSNSENDDEVLPLRNFIKEDPEKILRNTYIGNDKNANLQQVILMRLDVEKWKDISQKLGHPLARVSELYQRNIKKRKIIDYFRKYLQ